MWDYHLDQDDALRALKAGCLTSNALERRYTLLQAPPLYGKSHLLQYFILTFPETEVNNRKLPPTVHQRLRSLLEEEGDIFDKKSNLMTFMFQTHPLTLLRKKVESFDRIEEGVAKTLDLLLHYRLYGKDSLIYFLEELRTRYEGMDRDREIKAILQTLKPYLVGGTVDPIIDLKGEDDQGNSWHMIYVDLSQKTVYEALSQFRYNPQETASMLSRQLTSSSDSLLLCFDAIEQLNAPAREAERIWIEAFIEDLDRKTRHRQIEREEERLRVRFVLAGRKVKFFWREYRKSARKRGLILLDNPKRIFLKPFDKESMLLGVKQGEALDAKIERLYHYSGGYPGVASVMLKEENIATLDLGAFTRKINRLVRGFADIFFNEFNEDIARIVEVLGVFRILTLDLPSWLKEQDYLELPLTIEPTELWSKLSREDLLRLDNDVYYRLNIPRHIITRQLQLTNRQWFLSLQQMARVFYEERIKQPSKELPRQRAVVEWLYHTLQWEEQPYQELVLQMREYLELAISENNQLISSMVKEMASDDTELLFLFKQRYGSEKWEQFRKEVFHGDL